MDYKNKSKKAVAFGNSWNWKLAHFFRYFIIRPIKMMQHMAAKRPLVRCAIFWILTPALCVTALYRWYAVSYQVALANDEMLKRNAIDGFSGMRAEKLSDTPFETPDEMIRRISRLEERLRSLESGSNSKVFPEVKFLTYKDRKRILITGGAGFVGSHLVDRLLMEGHEVIVCDNFFTGRKRNVEHWIGHENFEMIHLDIVNPLFIEVDQIYHLASPASPPHYMYNPVKTIKTNTIGTINILGLAKRVRARVLIASTSEVYGDPEVHPQPESYWGHVNPIGPRACYDEAKRVAETLAYAYQSQENVDVRVARIFNTYGPRMHMNDGRVVSNFILQALQGHDLTVYGHGQQTRSFQYVSDLVDGLIRLMNSNYSLPVNIGNPEEHTIQDFATIIHKMVGTSSKIVNLGPVLDDPQRRRPDIKLADSVLGWKPQVGLEEGLQKTISYFKAELQRSKHSERNTHLPTVANLY